MTNPGISHNYTLQIPNDFNEMMKNTKPKELDCVKALPLLDACLLLNVNHGEKPVEERGSADIYLNVADIILSLYKLYPEHAGFFAAKLCAISERQSKAVDAAIALSNAGNTGKPH